MTRLLTAAEVAELLGTTERYVWNLGRRGVLPRVILPGGRLVRFEESAVDALIAAGRTAHATEPAAPAKRARRRAPAQVSFRF
jgi:excisionase family DNA binding protein